MSKAYQTNTNVEWNWGNGKGQGKVREVFWEEVTRELKGENVTRKANGNNPAYLIEQDDGDNVLKLHDELSQADS